ncbi:MAG: ATP-binding protein [Pseudomonadota bacterium]
MHTPDITIHIDQTLDTVTQQGLESSMREIDGVIAPRFNLPHMLVVLYNSEKTNPAALLDAVRSKGYQAQLVGM